MNATTFPNFSSLMPICRHIDFMDNMTMVVEGEPGKGSFFTMTLLLIKHDELNILSS